MVRKIRTAHETAVRRARIARTGDTLFKKSSRRKGDPYKLRGKIVHRARKSKRAPARRKVAGKRPVCRKHRVCISVGGKKVKAILNCKGKVQLTKVGRKTFNVLKRNCKCKKHTAYGVKRPKADGKYCPKKAHRK